MKRRSILALLGAGGLAGCVSAPGRWNAPDDPEPGVAVPSVRFGTALRYVDDGDPGIDAPRHAQFVFVDVPDSADTAPPDEFSLVVGEESFAPRSTVPEGLRTPGLDDAYTDADPSGALVFDVPIVDAESGWLVNEAAGTRHRLPVRAFSAFSAAPELRFEGLYLLTSADVGWVEAIVRADNRGERTGTFLALLERDDEIRPVELRVTPGEPGATRYVLETDAEEPITLTFVHAGGRQQREISLDEESG